MVSDGKMACIHKHPSREKEQIFLIHPDGGEALQLTKSETAVNGFGWSPDGKTIAFLADDSGGKEARTGKEPLASSM